MSLAAFPGAYGWGAVATGGRGGTIIEVSNLDAGNTAGSFTKAIRTSGARIIVFSVAGTITPSGSLELRNPDCTIAGQTAPGSGIVIEGQKLEFKSSNHIVRHITFRGDGSENNCIIFRSIDSGGCSNIIVDHCSLAWSMRNVIGVNHQTAGFPAIENVTVQNCIIAEPDVGHPTGLAVTQTTGINDTNHVSVHNNYFVHTGHRGPLVRAKNVEVINNVNYNWSNRAMDTVNVTNFGTPEADFINNDFLKGPMSSSLGPILHQAPDDPATNASIYISGNNAPDFSITGATADNWPLVRKLFDENDVIDTVNQRTAPLDQSGWPISIIPAVDVWDRLKVHVGNAHRLDFNGDWVQNRDSTDQRLIDDKDDETGPSTPPTAPAESIPATVSGTAYTDTDSDGMSDEYEDLNGLDKNSSADQNTTSPNGYTNIENFINGIPILERGGNALY